MAAPLVDRNTGDIIPASDHNDVKDYIEDGTYRTNTLSLNIGGTEVITSGRAVTNVGNITPVSNGGGALGSATLGFSYSYIKDTANTNVYRIEVVSGLLQATLI